MNTNFATSLLLIGTSFVSTNAFALSPVPNEDKTSSTDYSSGRIVLNNKEISSFYFKDGALSVLASKKSSILIIITNLATEEKTTTRYDLNVGTNEIPLVLPQSQYSITIVDSSEAIFTTNSITGQ
jgi:hypothetical protein